MKIIVGLGNPGTQYQKTRHNIGWLALDQILGQVKWSENKKFAALIYEDGEFLFVKPQTFMNNSGQSVQKILDYYKLRPKNLELLNKKETDLTDTLSVIHDDLDINFGDYRLSLDSGSAGHRGVQSIIDHLKTKKFTRFRLGIKNQLLRTYIPPDQFVLQAFSAEEQQDLPNVFAKLKIKN
jgi:PTH1 family peptidyl-tRNA hydrolase